MTLNTLSLSRNRSAPRNGQMERSLGFEELRLQAELEQKFQQFTPLRQARYLSFYKADLGMKQELLNQMLQEQENEYQAKLIGPKLRHCSTRTKDFCYNWFRGETNIKYREDAIALYESRIAVEEELTYIFESFSPDLRTKFGTFYENEFDGKSKILEAMTVEKKSREEQARQFARSQTGLKEQLARNASLSQLAPSEANQFSLRIELAKTAEELSAIEKEIEILTARHLENLKTLEKIAGRETPSKELEKFGKLDLAEQKKYLAEQEKEVLRAQTLAAREAQAKSESKAEPKTEQKAVNLEEELLLKSSGRPEIQKLLQEIKAQPAESARFQELKQNLLQQLESQARLLLPQIHPADQIVIKQTLGKLLK